MYISKLLEKVTLEKDLSQFKQCLMHELNISEYNESLMFSKILVLIYKQLSPNAIENIKAKMIEINENSKSCNDITTTTRSTIKLNHFSVLPSDCIDHLATFLSKKESIMFGYLNRDLYIETQKRSYLLKRKNNESLIIYQHYFDSKNTQYKINNFAFGLPTTLSLRADINQTLDQYAEYGDSHSDSDSDSFPSQHVCILQSRWFRSLFTRLSTLRCCHSKYLPFIPIDLLFNKNKNNESKEPHPIQWLYINFHGKESSLIEKNMNIFIKNYKEYFTKECESTNQIIRNIDHLEIVATSTHDNDKGNDIATFVQQLNHNYNGLWINCNLKINSLEQFYDIFHFNLKFLCINDTSCITFNNIKQTKAQFDKYVEKKDDDYNIINYNNHCKLKECRFELTPNLCEIGKFIESIHNLDYLKIRQNCQKMTIATKGVSLNQMDPLERMFNAPCGNMFFHKEFCMVLDRLLILSCTPNLRYIHFEIENDNENLSITRPYLNYLIGNRKKILNYQQIGKIELITFKWSFDTFGWDDDHRSFYTHGVLGRYDNVYDSDDCDDGGDSNDSNESILAVLVAESDHVKVENCSLRATEMSDILKKITHWFNAIRKKEKQFSRRITLLL